MTPIMSFAQMFSVESDRGQNILPTSTVFLGLEPVDFFYRGSDKPEGTLSFNEPIYRLRAELPGLNVSFGYNNRVGDSDSLSYFNVSVGIHGRYGLLSRRSFTLGIPIQLRTDFTQTALRFNDPIRDDFQQSSALLGAGLNTMFTINNQIRIDISGMPQYGFSVTSFGGTGGSMWVFEGRARLYFDNLFDNLGLAIGYDWRSTRYNLQDDRFDYQIDAHSFLIGVSF